MELSGQFTAHTMFGWLLSFPLMGPIVRSSIHGWYLRFPFALVIGTFLGI